MSHSPDWLTLHVVTKRGTFKGWKRTRKGSNWLQAGFLDGLQFLVFNAQQATGTGIAMVHWLSGGSELAEIPAHSGIAEHKVA
jgi:hypothetical protein